MKVTRHAKKRMKERCGLQKKSVDRIAKKALENGIEHKQTKGELNKWITHLYFTNTDANNIRIYGDKAYIFANKTLITVLQVPPNLTKDLHRMVKEKK